MGKTAKVAVSAQDKSVAFLLKYLQEAASKPTTFPPKGAFEHQNDKIFSLEKLHSKRVAKTNSFNFSKYVLGLLPLLNLITCCVIVLPPLFTFPASKFCLNALKIEIGLNPGCL